LYDVLAPSERQTRAFHAARARRPPGSMSRAVVIAPSRASRAVAPRARRDRRVPALSRRRSLARARGDDADADADAPENAPTPVNRRASSSLDGGKYGMGSRIDDALDASTNQTSFVLGGFLLTVSAVVLFAFGPRPPTEY
jgi:hypothetical protein